MERCSQRKLRRERPPYRGRRGLSVQDVLPLVIFALVGCVVGYLLGYTARAAEPVEAPVAVYIEPPGLPLLSLPEEPSRRESGVNSQRSGEFCRADSLRPFSNGIEGPPAGPEDQRGEEAEEPELVSLGEFTVTAYCACERCCGKWADGITAAGTEATEGRTVAVDPEVIGLGETVYFAGADGLVGGYVAEDTGGAIRGRRIDLYMDSHEAALEWGVQDREVFAIAHEQ